MDMKKTCDCGMPLNSETECSCQPSVCIHCCSCDPGCDCGCGDKK